MRYVALLRGIGPGNPAQRNENLRGVLTDLGLTQVRSVITSGNLVFDVPADSSLSALGTGELERLIQAQWPARLGFTSTTFLRGVAEFGHVAAARWFDGRSDDRRGRLQVTFLTDPTAASVVTGFPDEAAEVIHVEGRHIAWSYDQDQVQAPKLMTWLDRTFEKRNTTRTWRTVQRIAGAAAE